MGLLGRLRTTLSSRHVAGPDDSREEPPEDDFALDEDEKQHLLAQVRTDAAVEFLTATEPFAAYASELAYDAVALGVPRGEVDAVVRHEWERRVRLAREHGAQDMSGALRRAFAALETDGVVARETLGHDNEEGHHHGRLAARDAGADGYVFFHHQDAERLLAGPATLHLRFGAAPRAGGRREPALPATARQDEEVGRRVVAALQAQGLPVRWSGGADSTIEIAPMAWFAMPGPRRGSPGRGRPQ